jgi:hypothetical protein
MTTQRNENGSLDPVYLENGKWYFRDEIDVDSYGPFETEDAARSALVEYVKIQLGCYDESKTEDYHD